MKISVIITTLLVAQVSASFFDVFQGAVLSVQNSFGKLLSDVVTDVKETVDCTILAVEHVLSLSHDATTRYYNKCGSETNKTDLFSDARQDASLPKVEVTLNLPSNGEYLQKVIPAEIDARINETLSKVLGNFKPHDNVLSIDNVLAKESKQLAGVSDLVKKELEKLSNEVSKDLKKMEKQRDSEASVDTILQELKVLEKREQNSKNTSEANEIHQVIDQVLGKLDAIEATEATENFKLEEILKDLESNSNNNLVGLRNSNNNLVGLRHQLEEWKEEESRHLSEIKSKIEEHEKLTDHLGQYNSHESDHTQPVIFNMDINKDDVETYENSQDISSYNTTQLKSTRMIGDSNDKSLLITNSPLSSQNYTVNELNDDLITRTSYSSIESPLENVVIHPFENPNAYEFSEFTTVFATIQNNVTRVITNETVTNTTLEVIDRAPVYETIQPVQSIADFDKQQSLASNEPNILPINENNSNESVIISTTALAATDTPSSDSVKEELPNLAANNNAVVTNLAQYTEAGLTSTTPESFKNENSTDSANISTIASMMVENASVNVSNPEHGETANGKSEAITESTITSTTRNGGDSDTTFISTPIPTISTSESKTIQATLSTSRTTNSVNKESATITTKIINGNYSNSAMITTDLSSILNTNPVNKTIEPEEPIKVSDKETSSIDSNETMTTTTSSKMESTPVSETINSVENKTSAGNDESSETITESTSTSITENVSETTTTSTPNTIIRTSTFESVTIQAVDTTTLSTSEEYLTSTANRHTETPNTEDDDNDYDSSATVGMSTPEASSESISEANILASEDVEPLPSTTISPKTSPAMLMDIDSKSDDIITSTPFPISEMTTVSEVTDVVQSTTFTEDEEHSIFSTSSASIVTVTSKTENTDSAVVTEIIQKVETTTGSEEQGLSSTSTQSATNKIVTSTAYPPTESIPTSDEMAYRNELLTPNKLNQQNYDTNGEQRNNYEFNGPISLSDRLLQTRQPLINPEVPMYGQAAIPPITRGLFKDVPKWLPSNRLIPDFPGKIDNDVLQKAAFGIFDSAQERLSHSDSPFGPEKDIFRNIALIPNTPREPMDPPRMNYENPSYVPPSQHPIRPPFDSAPENTYRQLSLTTNRPVRIAAHTNNNKNPSFDYDSFFHLRDPEAHQRALKEARQLMANAKRSDRIINNIMKNKNKFKARPVFG